MESMQAIKNRIQRVTATQKITQAMHLVSSIKLHSVRQRMEDAKPYVEETIKVAQDIAAQLKKDGCRHPLIEQREVRHSAIFVVAGDQGLCGGYNVNVSRYALELIRQKSGDHVVTIGSKARDYLRRQGQEVFHCFEGIMQSPLYDEAREIGEMALALYGSQKVDEVLLVYTKFHSMINYEPVSVRLLPIKPSKEEGRLADGSIPILDPMGEAMLRAAVARYVFAWMYGAMTESALCELCWRMMSMDNAVKNSEALVDHLTLQYNRARQGAVTQELTEIVSGYNAL